jgi:hypothetical protein
MHSGLAHSTHLLQPPSTDSIRDTQIPHTYNLLHSVGIFQSAPQTLPYIHPRPLSQDNTPNPKRPRLAYNTAAQTDRQQQAHSRNSVLKDSDIEAILACFGESNSPPPVQSTDESEFAVQSDTHQKTHSISSDDADWNEAQLILEYLDETDSPPPVPSAIESQKIEQKQSPAQGSTGSQKIEKKQPQFDICLSP